MSLDVADVAKSKNGGVSYDGYLPVNTAHNIKGLTMAKDSVKSMGNIPTRESGTMEFVLAWSR